MYVVLGFPLSLPIDCIYVRPQTAIYATPSDYGFTLKKRETRQSVQEFIDDKEECQKTYYDRSKRPSYKVGEKVLNFNPTAKKKKHENLVLSRKN